MPARFLVALRIAFLAAPFVAEGALEPRPAEAAAARAVVLLTVDGLLPESYVHPDAHGLRVPTLRRFVAEGATSDGARSVFPSVTYPAHTSIATGVSPSRHGIVSNRTRDPLEKNLEGWRWYSEDVHATPIWTVAERAGLKTGLVSWPVTVGATASWVLPEFWRARTAEDVKLLRALTTPRLAAGLAAAKPDAWASFQAEGDNDGFITTTVEWLLRNERPRLLLVHLAAVDEAQHKTGLWSKEAIEAIEATDQRIARLIEATRTAGTFAQTTFVVASDHGFAPVTRAVRPGTLLREAGLVQVDDKQKVISARVSIVASAGQAYLYLEDGAPASEEAARRVFEAQAARPDGGIARIYDRAAIRAAEGDPAAWLAIEAQLGTTFVAGYAGPYVTPSTATRATHGYDPGRPEMRASLLVLGPEIPHGRIEGARLIDIAPTIASRLGLALPEAEGRNLFPRPLKRP